MTVHLTSDVAGEGVNELIEFLGSLKTLRDTFIDLVMLGNQTFSGTHTVSSLSDHSKIRELLGTSGDVDNESLSKILIIQTTISPAHLFCFGGLLLFLFITGIR